ncbi:unnamed protein product [Clonostachys solani]|uniref:Uncharacterized protein n=1 Tax=Clonostachys solani TaxID=160281 RepID=A0A9N9W7M0_9HYPO|nr:unnamed protein product [Clonostachys solani]
MAFLYQMLGSKIWPPRDIGPNLTGKTLLITGANSGLGYESVVKFVRGSAKRVIIGVRSVEKGEDAKKKILAQAGETDVTIDVYQLDMLDYDSIQAFASRVNKEVDRLEYVVLNAGISPHEFRESKYGFESALQVNLISTTLLSLLLLPKLMESQTSDFTPVLELVGSGTHQRLRSLLPDTDNPDKDPLEVYNTRESFEEFGFLEQYSLSKLFLMYVQRHLVDLVADEDSGLPRAYVVVVGPGPTQSAITREFDNRSLLFRMAFSVVYLMMKTAEQGARVYLSGLALGERGHGRFWQWDSIDSPAWYCSDPNATMRSERVWSSIVTALGKDVPGAEGVLKRAKQGNDDS